MQNSKFNITSLVVIVALLGLLTTVLFPAASVTYMKSGMAAAAANGKSIYVAITSANTDREPLGLPPIWPQSNPPTTNDVDISKVNFTNSTDYFWELCDGDHLGTAQHNPYVKGFFFGWLAVDEVKPHTGSGRLKPENNIWTIAKNVQDEMEDIIPILVTRNVAAESIPAEVRSFAPFERRLFFDEQWKTPFGGRGFVLVRKGGGTFNNTAKYMTHRVIYNNQTFTTTVSGSQRPGLCYLTPSKEVIPSEAVYQACAASHANDWKGWRYYRMIDGLKVWSKMGFEIVKYFPITALILGVFIFVRRFFDDQAKDQLSVMRPAYRILFWLAVTAYLSCLMMMFIGHRILFVCFTLGLAIFVQGFGCCYMVLWKRKTGNVETYRKAFKLMLMAPLIAFLGLVTVAILVQVVGFLV